MQLSFNPSTQEQLTRNQARMERITLAIKDARERDPVPSTYINDLQASYIRLQTKNKQLNQG